MPEGEDAVRILRAQLDALASGSFIDDWHSVRLTASGAAGFFARDPEADLASWLVLCPGSDSEYGTPTAPLREVVAAISRGDWDPASEGRAFVELAEAGEAVVAQAYLTAVEGAALRSDGGAGGRTFQEILEGAVRERAEDAASVAEEARGLMEILATQGVLDARQGAVLGGVAAAAKDALEAAGPVPDARFAARALGAAARVRAAGRTAALKAQERKAYRQKVLELFGILESASDVPEDYVVMAGTVRALIEDGELEAAEDVMTAMGARVAAEEPVPLLPGEPPACPAESFHAWLPWLSSAPDPFVLARKAVDAALSGEAGRRGARAAAGPPGAETVWGDFARAAARFRDGGGASGAAGAGGGGSAGARDGAVSARAVLGEALRKLLDWLGFGTGDDFQAGPDGGEGGASWTVMDVRARAASPVPAWGPGETETVSVLVWTGAGPAEVALPPGAAGTPEGDLPPGLAGALDAWRPGPGRVPLAVSLEPLAPGAWGAMNCLARRAGRDLVVLDPLLAAAAGASVPLSRTRRLEWLFGAGGIYGRFDPFESFAPVPGCTGLEDLVQRVAEARGVVRVEGPEGVGKSALMRILARSEELHSPAFGRFAVLADAGGTRAPAPAGGWEGRTEGVRGRAGRADSGRGAAGAAPGPLETAVAEAAGKLLLPGWNGSLGLRENLRALDRGRTRRTAVQLATVLLDSADGLMEGICSRPGDLELLMSVNKMGSFRLVIAGRRVSEILESHPCSPLYGLAPPFVLQGPEPSGLAESVRAPLAAMGWAFDRPSAAFAAMSVSFWNPAALGILMHASFTETRAALPSVSRPPYAITSRALRRAARRPALARALAVRSLAPVADPLRMAAALAAADLPELKGLGVLLGSRPEMLCQALAETWPEAFGDPGGGTAWHVMGELVASGVLAMDRGGLRVRNAAVRATLRSLDSAGLGELCRGREAPPEAALLSARRLLPWQEGSRRDDGGSWGAGGGAMSGGKYRKRGDGTGSGRAGVRGGMGDPESTGRAAQRPSGPFAPGGPLAHWAETLLGPRSAVSGGGSVRLPVPSPFTLRQEALLFAPGRDSAWRVAASPASGGTRADDALESLAELAGRAGPFAVRFLSSGARDFSPAKAFSVAAGLAPEARGGGPVHLVVDGLTAWDVGGIDGYTIVKSCSASRTVKRNAISIVTYLCPLEEIMHDEDPRIPSGAMKVTYVDKDGIRSNTDVYDYWQDDDEDDEDDDDYDRKRSEPAPVLAGRWSLPALRIWFAACGLDPGDADTALEETDGWDDMVIGGAYALAGLPYPDPLLPEDGNNAVPRGLAVTLRGLMDRRRVLVPRTLYRNAGPAGIEPRYMADPLVILAALGVLEPDGEVDGEPLWKLGLRF
ncbi:MAG: hypothetical protein LBT40_02715 [Deltaproteobacteria bacterium]|nr:hypothetical protein [Deltaproteobacteria bacterium]